MAYTTYQLGVLQLMCEELKNAFMTIQKNRYGVLRNMIVIKERFAEEMANLEKAVANVTAGNADIKKEVDKNKIEELHDGMKEEFEKLKTLIESLAAKVDENGMREAMGEAANNEPPAAPLNFLERIKGLKQQILSMDVMLTNSSVGLTELETTNYDGKLIWKIEDFQNHKEEAKKGDALFLLSSPFYTSRHGYKLCLRAYLNGDGVGKNTHISLHLILMKGEHDTFLPFPFKQMVSLYLLDQSLKRQHLMHSFCPDQTTSAFNEANSDMNIAPGCPMFVSHDTLENNIYLVDDTIFIRAVVDTTGLENF